MLAWGKRSSVGTWVVLCLILMMAPYAAHASPGMHAPRADTVPTEVCSCASATSLERPGSAQFVGRGPPILGNYDEQVGLTFTQDFRSIEYNVTAVEQTDPTLGDGPAYLVNGLSNIGYWYQVGVSWNWSPGQNPGSGFDMNYEVFDGSGNSVFPTNGQGGVLAFSGAVNPGDIVLLDLYFSNSNQTVTMLAEDTNTSAVASESYSSMEGTYFTGLPFSVANTQGFFTGLMTEWYHGTPYYSNEAEVVYSDPQVPVLAAWMWMDEFDANTFQAVFSANTTAPVSFSDPTRLQEFSFNGTTEYSDAYELITGSLNSTQQTSTGVPLTLSFSVLDGGAGYSPPVLTYVSNGTSYTIPLTQSATVYNADPGSNWSVSATLGGSTSEERWQTGGASAGVAKSPETIEFAYYYQDYVTFGFSLTGGGSGATPPTVDYTSFGASAETPAGAGVWADVGSRYQFSSPLGGSTSTERWFTETEGAIGSSHQVTATYYRQYLVTFDVSFKNTEVFPALSLRSTSVGEGYSATLVPGVNRVWLDSGSNYSVQQSFSLQTGQRLIANTTSSGEVVANLTVDLVYEHQFYIDIAEDAAGGTTSPESGWYDSGSTLTLDATPAPGWQFEGWAGVGSDSASGSTQSLSLVVGPGTPANETATFYPGVTVEALGPISVSFKDGPVSGTVAGGTATQVYVPPLSTLSLTASGAAFLTTFRGWSGASNSSDMTTTLLVHGPTTVKSDSEYDLEGVGVLALVIGIIVAATVLTVRRSRRQGTAERRAPASGETDHSDGIASLRSPLLGLRG